MKLSFDKTTTTACEVGRWHFWVEEVAQICFLVADKLSQKVILALEIVRLLVLMKIGKEINTIVWHFFCSSKSHGMGSKSNISIPQCLIEDKERLCWLADGIFVEPCCGVLTCSAFMVLILWQLIL
jgi:hypothetical protein